MEFAIEKCTELGVSNFIVFQAGRAISKGFNQKRIDKIVISAMKQSLSSWLPKVKYIGSLEEVNSSIGEKIIFDQNSTQYFNRDALARGQNQYLIFGPEGGFTPEETSLFDDSIKYKLADNRLRTETAIIKAVSLL